ncbi:phytoene dehydrogenase [Rhodoblastus sphagnicola]|uniref:Phytoene desaturase (neurosporene-forming) n=1 Tax=Rhodoblastus sphagnicola TaxID=333368 RepID=A0A2S6NCB7_9HYPH|nr:phytoene desaturase [Rhodoblastus sphagnicola]MBB4196815.1 phytoene desaturase [Rhodoblastus sphagnicola]PPQ32256.1 phytoene dehydrogenase [Rhodoblastus sphagnicola]
MLTVQEEHTGGATGQRKPVALVIGSGFGGLAAAVRLGARGYAVKVLERLDAPGGRAYQHHIDGFTFDAGPTIVTAPFLFEELWGLCGRKMSDDVELREMDPFYKIRFSDGETFTYRGDREAMRAEVERIAPGEGPNFDAFMAMSESIYRIGFEKLGDVPFDSLADMARIAPDLVRLQGYRSVRGLVSKFFKSERLRTIFSYHPLLIGGDPFRVSSIYCLVAFLEKNYGVHSAIGGTGALVRGLVKLIESQGGEIRYRADIRQILVESGRAVGVELSGGERLRADIVVSNADSAYTYRSLLPPDTRKRWTDSRLQRAKYSMGLFVWYFGVNRRYDDIGHHSILMGPRYEGLLKDIFQRKVLAEDFSLYLHRPTATDPSVAPRGCDTFYALSPVPNLQGGQEWRLEAEGYRKRIESWLEANILPDLSKHIVVSRVTTPLDFRDRLNAIHGEGFGLEPLLTQSAYFRPHNRSEDIENLFLVGAGVHPGAGLPGVLSSARILDKVAPDACTFA